MIPKPLREKVWRKYNITLDSLCSICNQNKISAFNFECGHIIPRTKGGDITLNNLIPICSLCNKSMGNKNLLYFKSVINGEYKYVDESINNISETQLIYDVFIKCLSSLYDIQSTSFISINVNFKNTYNQLKQSDEYKSCEIIKNIISIQHKANHSILLANYYIGKFSVETIDKYRKGANKSKNGLKYVIAEQIGISRPTLNKYIDIYKLVDRYQLLLRTNMPPAILYKNKKLIYKTFKFFKINSFAHNHKNSVYIKYILDLCHITTPYIYQLV